MHARWVNNMKNIIVCFFLSIFFPSTLLAGTLNDYNPWDVPIPDNDDGAGVYSDLSLSGAPSGATITKVKVYFEIRHTYPEDLEVWLAAESDGSWHKFDIYNQGDLGSADDVVLTLDNIHEWDGDSPNQEWRLYVRDRILDDVGFIDFFELWVDYAEPKEASMSIQSISSVIQGETLTVNCSVNNEGSETASFGVGAEIKDGSSVVDDLGQLTASNVGSDQSKTVTFTHIIPEDWEAKNYTLHAVVWSGTPGASEWLDDDNRTFSVVARSLDASITVNPIAEEQAGQSVSIPYEVTNDGNVNHAFGVGAEIWKGGVKQDDVGIRTTVSISPGGTVSDSFSYNIPSEWQGTYTARAAVWSGTPGSSTWLDSHDRSFTVTTAPLPVLTGRIAFHRDSNNLDLHAPKHADDGHIFVYDLVGGSPLKVTSGIGLGNAMNPHFSLDGSRITFMAIPSGQGLYWSNMQVYVLNLAEGSLSSGVPGQDPKFSPDGHKIVYKKNEQVFIMNSDGTGNPQQLTFGGPPPSRSGPNYSPLVGDGRIVYWKKWNNYYEPGIHRGDIAWRLTDGSEETLVYGTSTQHCYYPIWRDSDHILFTISEGGDDLYEYTISSASFEALSPLNSSAEDADPFPVNKLIGFSSTRRNGGSDYDLYIAGDTGSPLGEVSNANSPLGELGGTFSPYTYARTVMLAAPSSGSEHEAGGTFLLTTRLWSDGAAWSGASPTIIFTGPATVQYTGLKDDGTQGDVTPGDGVYSNTVALPSTTGSYTVRAIAQSVEPGITRQVLSSSFTVEISPANSDDNLIFGNGFESE